MTLFSCNPEQFEAIRAGLGHLVKLGFEVSLHEAEDPTARPKEAALPLKFAVTAMDHPGIVRMVVRILHQNKVNIQSLNTRVNRAPLSGAPLFDLNLEAEVPADKSITSVKEELEDLAAQENLDLDFKK